jgi:hypothetical protein
MSTDFIAVVLILGMIVFAVIVNTAIKYIDRRYALKSDMRHNFCEFMKLDNLAAVKATLSMYGYLFSESEKEPIKIWIQSHYVS